MADKKKRPGENHRVTIHQSQNIMTMIHKKLRRSAVSLALSIAALPCLVNGQTQSSIAVRKSSKKSDVSQLIKTVMKIGTESKIVDTLAPVIGLPNAMPMKKQEIVINEHDNDIEKRALYVIYGGTEKLALCAYFLKINHSGLDRQTRYFKVDLAGNLSKVIRTETKYEATGKAVRGSGVKFDQDINSPEVKKTFAAEMEFWLHDWLPKNPNGAPL